MTYILVLFMSYSYGVTTTNIPGFKTEAQCMENGKRSELLVLNSTKTLKFVCLRQEQ